jgi:CheY-like chemotaxis protein
MLRIFILEDDQNRVTKFREKLSNHKLTVADNALDAFDIIKGQAEIGRAFDVIFLDHDLGGEPPMYYGKNCDLNDPNTGSEVVRRMVDYQGVLEQPCVIIHSMNHPAAENMENVLLDEGYEFIHRIPFTKLVSHYFDDPSFLS